MFLKVEQGSSIYSKLFTILTTEGSQEINFRRWMRENLPEFNGNVLARRYLWHICADVEAWKFEGEVDSKTWQHVKGYKGYYEPNRRTKAGKVMRERISQARGERYNRMYFFDLFNTSVPRYGKRFMVPTGFVFDGVCYMFFDDGNYKDIFEKMAGQFTEISHGEWESTAVKYNEMLILLSAR